MGKLDTRILEQVIEGMSRAAKQAGCSLIGGENGGDARRIRTGDYDLAGFIVGAVERKKILDPRRARPGDLLLALPSSGLHTNGYSLGAQADFSVAKLEPDTYVAEVGNKIGAETAEAAPFVLAAAENHSRSRMGFIHGAHQPAAELPATCHGHCRATCRRRSNWLVAGTADFPVFGAARAESTETELLKTF